MTKQSCPFTVSFIAEISDTVGSRYLALHSPTLAAVALVQFITHSLYRSLFLSYPLLLLSFQFDGLQNIPLSLTDTGK